MTQKFFKLPMAMAAVLIASMALCANASAMESAEKKAPADYSCELRLGYAQLPVFQTIIFGLSSWPAVDEKLGAGCITGTFALQFDVNFKKWIALTVGLSSSGFHMDRFNSETGEKVGAFVGTTFSLLPQVRFNWLNRNIIRLYSSVGVGPGLIIYDSGRSQPVRPAVTLVFQASPIGISIGKRVYGFLETGVGTEYMGAMAGVGVRF